MAATSGVSAVVLDLDGVLVDSSRAVFRAWSRWARDHDVDPVSTFPAGHGLPTLGHLRAVRPDLATEAEAARIDGFEADELGSVTAMPGAGRFCAALPRGRWGIVTSCARDVALARLGVAGLPSPPVLVGCEDVARAKPAPDGYRRAMELLGAAPGDVLVVEDAPAGVRAARAAGAAVLAVLTTHTAAELEDADAVAAGLAGVTVTVTAGGGIAVGVAGASRRDAESAR